MKLQQILVPTDFSTHSQAALSYAGELAKLTGAQIHLAHVLEPDLAAAPEFGFGLALPGTISESKAAAEQTLAGIAPALPNVTRTIIDGPAVGALVNYATKHAIDLIVMSTHGRTGLAHVLLGSVAEGVIHKAPCPVLTARPEAFKQPPAT